MKKGLKEYLKNQKSYPINKQGKQQHLDDQRYPNLVALYSVFSLQM